ncbi:MAG TPA: hypothetical protein VNK50_11280 [Calidithermus sp.]|jgi:transcriptional antiterminator Rof (Rho-off)|nr:hypothetical protein [Calidithermus sp.]
MPERRSLEGWAPVVGVDITLDDLVDLAFDYRGDVTVECRDGSRIVGYVYNRDRRGPRPYLQLYEPDGTSRTLTYDQIVAIRFTGRDMAAGDTYEAWRRRKAAAGPRAEP